MIRSPSKLFGKNVDVGQHRSSRDRYSPLAGTTMSSTVLTPSSAGGGEHRNQLFLRDRGQNEIAAEVQHLDLIQHFERNVGRPEIAIGAERVDEAAILPLHIDDECWLVSAVGAGLEARHLDIRLAGYR